MHPGFRSTVKIKIGTEVYFHATTKSVSFFCKGLIVRLPTKDSRIYKIIILSVNTKPATSKETKIDIALQLLGKRMPAQPNDLHIKEAKIRHMFYDKNFWIHISEKDRIKILKKIK